MSFVFNEAEFKKESEEFYSTYPVDVSEIENEFVESAKSAGLIKNNSIVFPNLHFIKILRRCNSYYRKVLH